MSWPLDVNLILASRWTTHAHHLAAKTWIDSRAQFFTCAITELGFVRISFSPAYRATWDEAQEALAKLQTRPGYQFLADDVDGTSSPPTGSRDTTDAHLVTLAKRHGLKLATLDGELIAHSWAKGTAENPLQMASAAPAPSADPPSSDLCCSVGKLNHPILQALSPMLSVLHLIPAVRPFMDAMVANGYHLSPRLVHAVSQAPGEKFS